MRAALLDAMSAATTARVRVLTPDQVKWLLTHTSRFVPDTPGGALDIGAALAYTGTVDSANKGLTPAPAETAPTTTTPAAAKPGVVLRPLTQAEMDARASALDKAEQVEVQEREAAKLRAEALRVQLYWAIAAVPASVSDHYLCKQSGELGRIQFTLRGPSLW